MFLCFKKLQTKTWHKSLICILGSFHTNTWYSLVTNWNKYAFCILPVETFSTEYEKQDSLWGFYRPYLPQVEQSFSHAAAMPSYNVG